MSSAKSDAKKNKLMTEAKDIEKKLQESYRNEKSEMEHKAVSAIKKNSKYFYSYAKKYSKIATGIGPLIDQASNIVTCPLQMVHMRGAQLCNIDFSEADTSHLWNLAYCCSWTWQIPIDATEAMTHSPI